MSRIRLQSYDNSWYNSGRSRTWQIAWFFLGLPLLRSAWIPGSGLRVRLLRLFGAQVGNRVVIKPAVNVKYPWHLLIGDDCWIGEGCWIDNLTTVRIGSNVCISQGVYLCTGNHDWSDPAFGLKVSPITLEDGSWAGAQAILTPGSVLREGAVAAAGSVIVGSVPTFSVYAGNPAVFIKRRVVRPETGVAVPAYEVAG